MKLFLTILAALALACIPVARATAQNPDDTKPCAGTLLTDPAGDQSADQVPAVSVPAAAQPTEDNTDIRSVFFNTRTGADGKPVVTANIVITNLTKEIPELSSMDAVSYHVQFATTKDVLGVKALNDGGEISYHYRYFDATTRLATMGETTGAFVEGPMGVVQIRLPEQLSVLGTKIDGVYARVSLTNNEEERVAYTTADLAPDDGSSSTKSYTVTECPAADAPAGQQGGGTPTPPNSGQPAQPQPGAGQPAQPNNNAAAKKKEKPSCATKAKRKFKGKKNAKKRTKALKSCKKKAKQKRR